MRFALALASLLLAASAQAREARLPFACQVLKDIGVVPPDARPDSGDGFKGSVGFGGPPTVMSGCFTSPSDGRAGVSVSVMEFLADSDPYRQYADYIPPDRLAATLAAEVREGTTVRALDAFDVPAFWYERRDEVGGSVLLFSRDARVRLSIRHHDGREAAEALARRVLERYGEKLR